MKLALQNSIPAFRGIPGGGSSSLGSRITSLHGLGDSLMVGQNCKTVGWDETFGAWEDATDSFFNQLLAAFPAWIGNSNSAGRGTGVIFALVNEILDVSYGTSRKAKLCFAGYNDYRRLGTTDDDITRLIRHKVRSMFALQALKNWKPGSDYSAISNVAHWNTGFFHPDNTRTDQLPGEFAAFLSSPAVGRWIEYEFEGDAVVVGFKGSYDFVGGVSTDEVELRVDGVLEETWDTNTNEGIPVGYEIYEEGHYRLLKGFGPGTHTLRITTTTNRTTTGFFLDGIGECWDDEADFSPFIMMYPSRMTDPDGYAATAPTFNKGSDAAVALVKAAIDTEAAYFQEKWPDNYAVFDTTSVLDPATDFDTDLIHPKRIGMDNIATGLIAFLS